MRLRGVFVSVLLLAAAARPALAEPEGEVEAEARPTAIGLSAGVGTQYGVLTLSRSWPIRAGLSVETGIGLGLAGFKVLVFPKIETRVSAHGWLTFGAGLALGQHRWIEQNGLCWDDTCAEKTASDGVSATTTVAIEYRWANGWRFGPYLGADTMLNPDVLECQGGEDAIAHCERDHVADGRHRVFSGLRLARAF